MHPSILPSEVKAINLQKKSKKNSNSFGRLTTYTNNNQASITDHHFNQHHHQTSTIEINSESCEKDNKSETVMCMLTKNLQKFNIIKSQTKFHVAFRLIAFIIFLAVNVTYSNALPITNNNFNCFDVNTTIIEPGKRIIDCSADISKCIKNVTYFESISASIDYNIRQTNFTMGDLKRQMRAYLTTVGEDEDSFIPWMHFGTKYSELNETHLFSEGPFLKLLESNLKFIFDRLFNVTKLLSVHICRHTKYADETIHKMQLENKPSDNDDIISQLKNIQNYTNQSIYILNDTLNVFGFRTIPLEFEVNCSEENTTTAAEMTTMKKLEGILNFMAKMFEYIENNVCMPKNKIVLN